MLRRIMFFACLLIYPALAVAGPKEDAAAVLDRLLSTFTAADINGVLDAFWPDALLWGNLSTQLATNADEVRGYFKPVTTRQPNELRAAALSTTAVVVSDAVVLISGLWQRERIVDGKPVATASRLSAAITKRGNEWKIAQFHSSARPNR